MDSRIAATRPECASEFLDHWFNRDDISASSCWSALAGTDHIHDLNK